MFITQYNQRLTVTVTTGLFHVVRRFLDLFISAPTKSIVNDKEIEKNQLKMQRVAIKNTKNVS